jgi:hypothetical protein
LWPQTNSFPHQQAYQQRLGTDLVIGYAIKSHEALEARRASCRPDHLQILVDGQDEARLPIAPYGTIPADVCAIQQQPGFVFRRPPSYLACWYSLGERWRLGPIGSRRRIDILLQDGGDGLAQTAVYLPAKIFEAF